MKRIVAVICVLSIVLPCLSGCSGTGEEQSGSLISGSAGQADNLQSGTTGWEEENLMEPMEISVAYWGLQEAFYADNAQEDEIFHNLCDRFHITIKPVEVSWNDYQDKNKIWAASDNLPDVFAGTLLEDDNALYQTWAREGILKEIPVDLNQYANLDAVMSLDAVKAAAVDGRQYMMPRGATAEISDFLACGMGRPILYRRDWAAQAGYDRMPENYEEFAEMLAAMKEQHPEAAGLCANNASYLSTLALDLYPEFCNEGAWVYEDGKWMPAFCSRRVLPYIERLQELYREGILDADIMTQKDGDALAKFVSGHACAILGGEFVSATNLFMEMNPEVRQLSDAVGLVMPFQAADGHAYVFMNKPYWSETYVSSRVGEEKLERILMLMDYMYSHEYAVLVNNGIEGVDWERRDGQCISLLAENQTLAEKYPITCTIGYLASWFTGFELTEDAVIYSNPAQRQYQDMVRELLLFMERNCEAAPINFDVFLMNNEKKAAISDMGNEFVLWVNDLVREGTDAEAGWRGIIGEFEERGLEEAVESVTAQAKETGIKP